MTKQEIIKDLEPILYGASLFPVADTLLTKFEQEKQELAREIFEKLLNTGGIRYNEFVGAWETCCSLSVIKRVAKEYGVEL